MTCPVCGGKTTVINSRSPDCETVRRRRVCQDCLYRFSTLEIEEETVKRDTARKRNRKQTGEGS